MFQHNEGPQTALGNDIHGERSAGHRTVVKALEVAQGKENWRRLFGGPRCWQLREMFSAQARKTKFPGHWDLHHWPHGHPNRG